MPDSGLAPLVAATRTTLAVAPAPSTTVTFRAASHQETGLRSNVRIRDLQLAVDEPPANGLVLDLRSNPTPLSVELRPDPLAGESAAA
jgi:hypothetical protein